MPKKTGLKKKRFLIIVDGKLVKICQMAMEAINARGRVGGAIKMRLFSRDRSNQDVFWIWLSCLKSIKKSNQQFPSRTRQL
jgi:hypothetical protein